MTSSIEQQARELLAAEYEKGPFRAYCNEIRSGIGGAFDEEIRAMMAALRAAPEAVDVGPLRELAESWKVVSDPDPTPIMQAHQHATHCCADELLALIDSQRTLSTIQPPSDLLTKLGGEE